MTGGQFSVDPGSDGGFYVIVGDTITVYQEYADALTEIQPTLADTTDAFLAEVLIEPAGADDLSVTLEQVPWQRVIRDLSTGAETAGQTQATEESTQEGTR